MSINYKFLTKNISTHKTDILVLWTSSSLLAGDESFLEIHSTAGSSIKNEIYNIKYDYQLDKFNFGENIITSSGILPIEKLIHSVLPNCRVIKDEEKRRNLLKRTVFNIDDTVKEFEKKNYKILDITILPLSEKIYGEVKDKDIEFFIKNIFQYYKNYHSITFLFSSEVEKKRYEKIFKKVSKSYLNKIKKYARYFGINIKI